MFLIEEGIRGLTRNLAMSLASITSIFASLLLLAAFVLIAVNGRRVVAGVESRKDMTVFLEDRLPPETVLEVGNRLRAVPGVREVTFVSKDQAWRDFQLEMEGTGFTERVYGNPLPSSYRVSFRSDSRSAERITAVAAELEEWEEVEEVSYGGNWVKALDRALAALTTVSVAIGILVCLSVIAVVANTIRLTVLARREMIVILRMIGATERFIQAPFLVEGVLATLVAAGFALLVLFLVVAYVARSFGIQYLSLSEVSLFLLGSVALGWTGSFLALRRVLSQVSI
jgi:cell division transport system permease protein